MSAARLLKAPCERQLPTRVLGLMAALVVGASPLRAGTVNRIVAIVNDEVITEADIDAHLSAWREQRQDLPEDLGPEALRQAVLRRLIEQQVILQAAKREGVAVSPEEIAKRMDEIQGQFESVEAFEQSLAEAALSAEQLKEHLRRQLVVQRLIEAKVRATITVSPQEVAQEIEAHPELARPGERVRASHILVRVNERRSAEQARATLEELRRRLSQGAEFSDLARRHSEDSHAEEGGAMGWVAQGELLPELDDVLFSLPEGELSGPIQTRLGFHLVQVHERRAASSLPVTEANHAVYQQLYQKKFQQAFSRWLNGLLRRAYIEILAPQEAEG